MGPIGCPETSVIYYHYSLRYNPEVLSSHLLRGGSPKSRIQTPYSLFITFHTDTFSTVWMRCLQWIRPNTALSLLRSQFWSHSGFIDLCVVCSGPSSLLRKAVRSVRGTDDSAGRRVSPIIAKSEASWVFWQNAPGLEVAGYKNPTAFLYHSRITTTASLAFLYASSILHHTFSLLSDFALLGDSSFSDSRLCPTVCNITLWKCVYVTFEIEYLTWLSVCRVQLKCDGTRWRTGGEVKGKLANGVGSQYP